MGADHFSNEDAKATFMKDPQGNLAKARALEEGSLDLKQCPATLVPERQPRTLG